MSMLADSWIANCVYHVVEKWWQIELDKNHFANNKKRLMSSQLLMQFAF